MWIVRIALSRPYTFIVLAILLLIFGVLTIFRTPTDIFPDINIPVVSVVWTYTGMPPEELSDRITSVFERAVTTTVNDIEHMESQSHNGIAVIKIFFRPTVDISVALSQVTAISQTLLRSMPQGVTPPQVLSYSASSVPVMQIVLSSLKLSEQAINDWGNNFIRSTFIIIFLSGCSLAPTYHRPEMEIPAEYKEMGTWMQADPKIAEIDRGKWWEIYNDAPLNALEEKVTSANQDLKAALARFEEATAVAAQARSYLFPTLGAMGIPSRQKTSATVANPNINRLYNDFLGGAALSYEIDVWGRVRNAALSAKDLAKASAADLAFVDLSLHAQLASDYFSL